MLPPAAQPRKVDSGGVEAATRSREAFLFAAQALVVHKCPLWVTVFSPSEEVRAELICPTETRGRVFQNDVSEMSRPVAAVGVKISRSAMRKFGRAHAITARPLAISTGIPEEASAVVIATFAASDAVLAS